MQFDRVCCLVSQYTGRPPMQAMGSTPLLPHSLELDMSPYPRKFEQDHIAPDMIPLPFMPENSHFPTNSLILEEETSLALELAVSTMDEVVKMCHMGEPLWVRATDHKGKQVLNLEEYARTFSWSVNLKQHPPEFRTEATRDTAVVIMNSITLVDAFLHAVRTLEC